MTPMLHKSLRLLLETNLNSSESRSEITRLLEGARPRCEKIEKRLRSATTQIFVKRAKEHKLLRELASVLGEGLRMLLINPETSADKIEMLLMSLSKSYAIITSEDISRAEKAIDETLSDAEAASSGKLPPETSREVLDVMSILRAVSKTKYMEELYAETSGLMSEMITQIMVHDPLIEEEKNVRLLGAAIHVKKIVDPEGHRIFLDSCRRARDAFKSDEALFSDPHYKKFLGEIKKLVDEAIVLGVDSSDIAAFVNWDLRDAAQAALDTSVYRHARFTMLEQALQVSLIMGEFDMRVASKTEQALAQVYRSINAVDPDGIDQFTKVIVQSMKEKVFKPIRDSQGMPSEANPKAKERPFGDYVFAPERKRQVPNEKNTPAEQETYDQLYGHIERNSPMSQRTSLQLMQILDDDTYPSILHEPRSEFVYRGVKMNQEALEALLGTEVEDEQGETRARGMVSTRTGEEGSTSWTTVVKSACEFAAPMPRKDFAVIMVARRSENPSTFLEGPDGFYKVKSLASFEEAEKETIALGPVRLYKIYWKHRSIDEQGFKESEIKENVMESKMSKMSLLRRVIREMILREADISDVSDMCYTAGSTHLMQTCKIGGNKFFLKFSDEGYFEGTDPSLQILIEYLAYRIYGLFSGITIPRPELVYDSTRRKVGLATTPASGKMALKVGTDPKFLAKMMTQGVYVDVFLANWDVIGTGSGNVFIDDERATRIDPGGSLTFRAQGGRKGKAFGPKVGELSTMLKAGSGAGNVYKYADLKVAAKEFMSVSWPEIESEIDKVRNEVSSELERRGMEGLLRQWNDDVNYIKSTLSQRHSEVMDHANYILS